MGDSHVLYIVNDTKKEVYPYPVNIVEGFSINAVMTNLSIFKVIGFLWKQMRNDGWTEDELRFIPDIETDFNIDELLASGYIMKTM